MQLTKENLKQLRQKSDDSKQEKKEQPEVGKIIRFEGQDSDLVWILESKGQEEIKGLERFPLNSQMVVPLGMSAVVQCNGKCVAPFGPGLITLEDSALDVVKRLRAIVDGEDKILDIKVFFVRDKLPMLGAYGKAQVPNRDGKYVDVSWGGRVGLAVTDALKFLSGFGFHKLEKKDLDDQDQNVLVRRIQSILA